MKENKFLKYFLLIWGGAQAAFLMWLFYYHYIFMDHVEHLHAAWLIWKGEVPYRDFFEHHNPLFWYMIAPIVAAFYNNALILYVSRVIALCGHIFMAAGFYRLCCDFMAVPKKVFWLGILLFLLPCDNTYLVFELQPDAMMWGCFFWGLWFYCRFVDKGRDGQEKDIRNAYILFFLSFLFLQKILMLLAAAGVYTLYLMKKKAINAAAALKMLAYPAAGALLFLLYLHYTNCWDLYFLFNYDLNMWMQDVMGNARIFQTWYIVSALPVCAILTLHYFLRGGNRYRNLLCGLMFAEFIGKMLVGAPYVQYFIFSNLLSALVVADYLAGHSEKWWGKALLLAAVAGGLFLFWRHPPNMQYPRYYTVHDYIMRNARDDEPIINPVLFYFNIYGSNPAYYWFGYGNVAQVAYYVYGVGEPFDLNKMIYENMPKFVYAVEYINQMGAFNMNDLPAYRQELGKMWEKLPEKRESKEDFIRRFTAVSFGAPDLQFLKAFYKLTPYSPLLVRKDLPAK